MLEYGLKRKKRVFMNNKKNDVVTSNAKNKKDIYDKKGQPKLRV